MPCKEGQTGKSRDLGKMPEIGPCKANDLGRGTCGSRDNAPSSPMRGSASDVFWRSNRDVWLTDATTHRTSTARRLWLRNSNPNDFQPKL